MAIVQGDVKIFRLDDDVCVGNGRCAVHIPQHEVGATQYVSGTIVVNWAEGPPEQNDNDDDIEYRLVFEDGRQLNVVVTKSAQTEVGAEVLRFRGRSQFGPLSR